MDKKPTVYVQVPYMCFFVIFNSYLVDPDPEKKSEKPNHCDVSGSSFEKLRQAYGTTVNEYPELPFMRIWAAS